MPRLMMSAFVIVCSGAWMRKRSPSTPARRRQRRQLLERRDELRAAVGIAGVVERVDADDDVVRAEHFGPAERQRQEDRVARRHVGRRDVVRHRSADPWAPECRSSATIRRTRDRSTSSSMCRDHAKRMRRRRVPPRAPARAAGRSGWSSANRREAVRAARSPRRCTSRARR